VKRTLSADLPSDSDGKPKGEHQTWSCDGKLLSQATMPAGRFRKWAEVKNGEPVLVEEGARVESGQLDGEHRMYNATGTAVLVENWKDEKRNGDYKRLNATSTVEAGRYEMARRPEPDRRTATVCTSTGTTIRPINKQSMAAFCRPQYRGVRAVWRADSTGPWSMRTKSGTT
jgi:antitoxin component YwqK of YwqJK toxin-antitoxin module